MAIYFLIAILATTVGSLTGMGGGVIIKPVLDVMGGYDVATIGILSSITVFAMSSVSMGRQMLQHAKIPYFMAIPLSIGSVIGGTLGQKGLDYVIIQVGSSEKVTLIQNVALSVLILVVFLYMQNKDRIKTLKLRGLLPAVLTGVGLGVISSFLGIGGGPINVAILIYLFSLNTKTAAICSIMTILFAQISKLGSVILTTGFAIYDLKMLPVMVIGGVAGGLIGASLNKKLPDKKVEFWFNVVQLVVLGLSIFNILKGLGIVTL